ncbi:hypothetical protein [Acidimangrovimonas pyrenivorans]|uniref:Lipoprotein n=1 Tax=Acidimangrovimonas pyrenivorans TaxID=2030798 RepID=A0ABV7AGG8_9RHOB
MSAKRPASKSALALLLAAATAVGPIAPLTALPAQAETAVAPEKNPAGDIPDTQVFITYRSAAGYALKVPEGWARSEKGADVRFVDKLDAVSVTVQDAPAAVSLNWLRTRYLPVLEQQGRAVRIDKLDAVQLPGGKAFRISYADNSEPNPVTGKQVRLEHNLYLFAHGGKLAALNLSAPYGADNADQWRLMSRSFRWP